MSKPEVDILIRLVSATYPFRCPQTPVGNKISFTESFKTVGSHPKTQTLLTELDGARDVLVSTLSACSFENNGAGTNVVEAANAYIPLFQQILLTCLVQPELCKLDARLSFEWSSAFELDKQKGKAFRTFYRSEAMMYELVMAIACNGMGRAVSGFQEQRTGDYAAAAQHFKAAAGAMQMLSEEQLPKWASKSGDSFGQDLPSEAKIESAEAFKTLFLAVGQQMAVATSLNKPGTPNFSLLAKLCLGISEQMDLFVGTMSSKASLRMAKIDPYLFALVRFQIKIQKAVSTYFLARSSWDNNAPGLAIAFLNEAIALTKIQDYNGRGQLPKLESKEIMDDAAQLRQHMKDLLGTWQAENSTIYFESVPSSVPEDAKLPAGMHMMKPEPYELAEEVTPVQLMLPARKMPGFSSFFGFKK